MHQVYLEILLLPTSIIVKGSKRNFVARAVPGVPVLPIDEDGSEDRDEDQIVCVE